MQDPVPVDPPDGGAGGEVLRSPDLSCPIFPGDFLQVQQLVDPTEGNPRLVAVTVANGARPVQLYLEILACREAL